MSWSYKTVRFDLKKDGILGSAFLDEAEIEVTLNEFGKVGWELVSFIEVEEGLLAVFKMFNETFVKIDRNAILAEEQRERSGDTFPPEQGAGSEHPVPEPEREKIVSEPVDSPDMEPDTEESADDVGAIRIE